MEIQNEKKLLNIIKVVPIIILILFSIITTYFVINYQDKLIQQEIKNIKTNFINIQKDLIKKEVNKIHNMIEYEYNYFNKKRPKEETTRYILSKIEAMRYDKDGYIFIIDYDGNFLINVEKSLIERNQINLTDKAGFQVTKEIIKLAKQKEGYISYIGLYGTHDTQSKKISYVKGLNRLNWAIGYGFHPNDIEAQTLRKKDELKELNKDFVKRTSVVSIFLTVAFIIFFIIYAKNIKNRFTKYKNTLQKIEDKNRQKDEIIFHQSKMATIGELLNIISHQWRQPLAQINSLTMDMYIEQKQGSLGEKELKDSIINIEKTTQYLSNTIDDFSRFFVQEKDKSDFLPQNAIQECINILSPSLKHIEIEINIIDDTKVNGYITLYQQVILTILTNSIDAFESRNIEKPKITIDINTKKTKSYISIMDNAKGIDEKNIDKVFDLYFSTKNDKKVTGLGLYIAKQIIHKNMNGKIKVKNINDGINFMIKV